MRWKALVFAAVGTTVVACGSTSDISSSGAGTPGATALCQGKATKPGYTNGIANQPNEAKSLSGAGSTFIAPMLSTWTGDYAKVNGVQVAYQAIGSGGGIKQVQAGTVDFGDSDAYMKDSDISAAQGPVLQIPLLLAPVVVTYNVPGMTSGLHLDSETVGKIFAGTITAWNDPAITAQNAGKTLPASPIAVVHRSDGSGTTDIFTDYLTKASPSWVTALGGADKSRGKTVAWPVGIGGKGNDGVSAAVNQTTGAIGYVELAYAIQQNLAYATIKNHAGNYIEPCIASVKAAAEGAQFPDDLRFDLTNAFGASAYPITGSTWMLVYTNQTDAAKAAALVNFLSWVLTTGQDMTLDINYTPLGSDLQQKAIAQVKKLTLNGQLLVK